MVPLVAAIYGADIWGVIHKAAERNGIVGMITLVAGGGLEPPTYGL